MKAPLHHQHEVNLANPTSRLHRRRCSGSNRAAHIIIAPLVVMAVTCAAGTQVSFTRILEGDIANDAGHFLGCAWGDYDNDGYVDLFVGNDLGLTNRLYHNNGNGTFTCITTGTIVNERGDTDAPVWGDFDNDGDLDLFCSNYESPARDFFYRNDGNGTFTKITQGAWVTDSATGVGAAWGDYDNDGYIDLFVANDLGQNNRLYHNAGDGTFSPVSEGAVVNDGGRSRSCAWADYDNDGYLDLFVANGGYDHPPAPPQESGFLYHNEGGTNNWMILKLVGTASNRSAIGAKVRVLATIGGKSFWQLREISGGGGGWGSQNDLRAHFGLGDATTVDKVRIEWPSGNVQELINAAPKQILTVTEHQEGATLAPSLAATKMESDWAQLTLTGPTNLLYVIDASTNLVQWTKIAVRTNLTGSVEFTDRAATNYPQRFYRAVAP